MCLYNPDVTCLNFQNGTKLNIHDLSRWLIHSLNQSQQLIDDYLDFTASELSMGKPVCADLQLGLATAPVLYASEQVRCILYIVPERMIVVASLFEIKQTIIFF